MSRQKALQAIGTKVQLPTLPEVVTRINAMIDDPNVGLQQMGKLVAGDPAITARVLRLANSGYYGLSEPVCSAERAVTVIGARSLRNVAMQVSIIAKYEHLSSIDDFDLEGLWKHSLATATICQSLAEICYRRTGLAPDDFYACGLLHDMGKVVMLESLSDQYLECVRRARLNGLTLHEAEEGLLGFTHLEVGALLAGRWQLPEKVAMAIEFHHGPKDMILNHPHVAVVAIGDQIAYHADGSTSEHALDRLAVLAEKILGIRREEFGRVVERASAAGSQLAA
jgi:putative nucleotidyltransferase with HDIG domain